jgi:protein involved in polysaccharide export with SLBB domain
MRVDARAAVPSTLDAAPANNPENNAELTKLERLWNERQATASRNEDYPIGPGDVLTVSVQDVEELSQRRVRVSAQGNVKLPLAGSLQVAGLSEDAVAAEIDDKLRKYMYQPEATVFVDEYHNRAVAVVGAVNHPGLVLLTSPSESLLDVITQSGGLSGAAADELILIPSRPGTIPSSPRFASAARSSGDPVDGFGPGQSRSANSAEPALAATSLLSATGRFTWSRNQAANLASAGEMTDGSTAEGSPPQAESATNPAPAMTAAGHDQAHLTATTASDAVGPNLPLGGTHGGDETAQPAPPIADEALQLAGGGEAITFKLKGATLDGAGKYINMPMRPGDVLIVPGGGDVMVVGWVHQPGRFQVGSGLTVLGAIGAAGGPMYAAKTNSIALIRTGKNGDKITIPINMDQITRGETVDLPVQANDVIDVPYSGLRIGPYIFYSILTRMGIGAPIPY